MSKMYEKLQKCVSVIRGKTDFVPEVALILGSGLGEYAKNMDVKAEVPYSEIEGFPVSTVAGHDGRFLFGYVGKVPMVIMKGRVHYGPSGCEKGDPDQRGRWRKSGFPAGRPYDDHRSHLHVCTESASRGKHRRTGNPFSGYEPCVCSGAL